MTQYSIDASQTVTTRTMPISRQDVRTLGNSGAGGFNALFAEKMTSSPAEATPVDEDLAKAEDVSEQAETTDGTSGKDDADDAEGAAKTDPESDTKKAAGDDASVADADPEAGTQPDGGAVDGSPVAEKAMPSPIDEQVDVSSEQTEQAQVRRELKHAASVDLSDVARAELLGRVDGFRPSGPVVSDGGTSGAARPDGPPPPIDPRPGAGDQSGERQDGSGREGLERAGLPTPSVAPPVGSPVQEGADTSDAAMAHGKRPPASSNPLSAPGANRGAGDPPPDAKQQITADVSRVAVLDRLVNQSAARRGAVASVDRVQVQAPAESSIARKANLSRPEPSNPTRDAFLSPVQRGLGKLLAEGGGKMTVMLRPRELGDVKIAMETERGAVRVRIEASSEAARKTLESGLDTLRATLETRGVRVETMEVHQQPGAAGSDNHTDNAGARRDGNNQPFGDRPGGSARDGTQQEHTGDGPAAPRGIWTELGIDAVA